MRYSGSGPEPLASSIAASLAVALPVGNRYVTPVGVSHPCGHDFTMSVVIPFSTQVSTFRACQAAKLRLNSLRWEPVLRPFLEHTNCSVSDPTALSFRQDLHW